MTTIRPEVKARILRTVAKSKYPLQALPSVASSSQLSLDEVKAVVQEHGWPKPDSMLRAAGILERLAAEHESGDVDDAGGETRVAIGRVHPDPDNVRQDLGELVDLTESLGQIGMLQPILVRRQGDRLVVVAGHRRLAAAQRLGWVDVPVVTRPLSSDDVLLAMIHENGQRRDLDPIEEARAYRILKDRDDLTDMDVAHQVGKSQPHVSNRLALLDLPPNDQAAIRAGTMTLAAGTDRGRKLSGRQSTRLEDGRASTAHLSGKHPLASAVEDLCRQQNHNTKKPGRPGGVGCGECWEAVIRFDERALATTARGATS